MRVRFLDIVYRGQRGRVHVVFGGFDAHPGEFFQVIGYRTGRVVGEEGVADAEGVQAAQEVEGEGEDVAAQVDGAVHIQGDVLEAAQPFRLRRAERLIVVHPRTAE